jgi:hypothetical protein
MSINIKRNQLKRVVIVGGGENQQSGDGGQAGGAEDLDAM